MRGKSLRVELRLNGELRARFEGGTWSSASAAPGATSGEAGGETGPERSQSGRQERLDGGLLRSPQPAVVESDAYGEREN